MGARKHFPDTCKTFIFILDLNDEESQNLLAQWKNVPGAVIAAPINQNSENSLPGMSRVTSDLHCTNKLKALKRVSSLFSVALQVFK